MEAPPILQSGDVFVTSGEAWYQKAIMKMEKIHSKDHDANYGHAGIITSAYGNTFEALLTAKEGSINNYYNQPVLIARPLYNFEGELITLTQKHEAIKRLVDEHKGDPYPLWRLAFFFAGTWAAKMVSTGNHLVCSELQAKYLKDLRTRDGWKGVNPDDLADSYKHWKYFKVTYEGIWRWRL